MIHLTDNGTSFTSTESSIDVLLQELQITSEDVSVSWSLIERDSCAIQSSGSDTRSVVYTSNCDTSNNSVAVNTTNTFATIPFDGEENTYFNLTVFDGNSGEQIATINEPFRINPGGKLKLTMYNMSIFSTLIIITKIMIKTLL